MERWSALRLNSTSLPPGMRVGMWELGDWRGHGTYGTVYSAVKIGDEEAGLVALKMANHPEDQRYGREVELLSRVRHPNVPRLQMDAVRPDIDVAPRRQIPLLPAHVLTSPGLPHSRDGRCR